MNHTALSRRFMDAHQAQDPHLGLELYLQVPTRHGVLWSYNLEQIVYLQKIVQADLRQCSGVFTHHKYSNRLPAWVKSARNRKEIDKAVLRLMQMASSIQPLIST
ncbi:hypothetical protein EC844_13923 [Acinetobacter calcoaceticus]|uniref:Uncharacterized protein n=1 Tax=Acinetobacter calcoaceticus TaxID=471 RepID=A0A4R1XD93_ACICA|nr:hypothetical protein EC844_13923 [Acinetobacter calcoaceticus]